MRHHGRLGLAVWPCFAVLACVLLVLGCQDGSGPNLITSPEGEPTFDGVKPPPPPPPAANPAIAFRTEGRVRGKYYSYLKVMNADGTNMTTILTSEHGTQGRISERASWSPGGGSIAFVRSGGELWLIDVSVVNGVPTGSNTRLLVAQTPDWSIDGIDWAPLGNQIVFSHIHNPSLTSTLKVVPASGGTPVAVYSSATYASNPVWSPDVGRIAFLEDPLTENGKVRVLSLDDWSVTTVLEEDFALTLSWARTQDVLAFEGNSLSGQYGICTMRLPSGPRTFVCGGQAPDWSPDDREMVFAVPHDGIWKVDVASGVRTRLAAVDDVLWPVWKR